MTHLHRLFAHMAWADRRLLALLAETPSAQTPSVLRTVAHLVAAERIWLLRLRGEDSAAQPVWPEMSLEQATAMAAENAAAYARLLAGLAAGGAAEIEYANSRGDRFRTRAEDVLLHVALHGSYHRGQIAAAVRAAGGEPVNTDYVAFVRETG